MTSDRFYFADFEFDAGDRQLRREGEPVELNARYLDALALLVREHGRLISKQRFLDEIWNGTPVTDEALTQCIRTLRRRLGDEAANPRFIETVPKHGYRFIAPVDVAEESAIAPAPARKIQTAFPWRRVGVLGAAGTAGGGAAGLIGGLLYGFAAASPGEDGTGGLSVLLVLVFITFAVALTGGAGVSFGIAASELAARRRGVWSVAGGAFGGLVVGAAVKLIGVDTINLLFGHSPGDITGAAEGAMLGAGIGLGAWLGMHGAMATSPRRAAALAGLTSAASAILLSLTGGRLMGGSLDVLSRQFPDSRLNLHSLGALSGESGFGPVAQTVTAGLEGALFGACIAGAMMLAQRRLREGLPV